MKENIYITTTIPYVNAEPHIGFALEVVQADALARFYRLLGHNVFYNAGTDEHGQKIWECAQHERKDVQEYVDHYAEAVGKLKGTLNLSYDNFVRTTDAHHKKAAQALWKLCEQNGDIYKKKYKGLYCVGCEKFLVERDLVDGKCPLHPNKEPVELEEENYFFKLSNYQSFLEEYLSQPSVIIPPHRLKEAKQFVKNGLEDFSISREKDKLPWGVPVPGDESQIMYVWFDALTNYISTLGWPEDENGQYKKFWENGRTIQMVGKDQIRFQSIMWPAMLKSAGLPVPQQIFYHGFINSGGQRMSKSLGNVISPFEMVERYGIDAIRYMLLRHVHPVDDSDVTWERMDEWYNANLANGLGNFVSRVMKLAEDHLEPTEAQNFPEESRVGEDSVKESKRKRLITEFRFSEVMDEVWDFISFGDELIQKKKPFNLLKENPQKGKEEVLNLVWRVARISNIIEPFMPRTAKRIKEAIRENKKPETLFPRIG